MIGSRIAQFLVGADGHNVVLISQDTTWRPNFRSNGWERATGVGVKGRTGDQQGRKSLSSFNASFLPNPDTREPVSRRTIYPAKRTVLLLRCVFLDGLLLLL